VDNSRKPLTIDVDHRENCPELIATLRDPHGFDVHIGELKLGDYRIAPDTVIERKTTDDFCLSIIDGRLFRQAYRLADHCQCPIIIIEGESFANRQYDVGLTSIKGSLISLAQTFRIPVLRTRNQVDTAWHLYSLAQQRRRVGRGSGVLRGPTPKRPASQRQYIVRSIPGVGPKLARLLLDEFGTVEAIARAPADELASIPGLGRKRAESIHNILHEDPAIYHINT
jgi:DNA excision repair protein ERCC-4